MEKTDCKNDNKTGMSYVVPALLLTAVGVVGLFNGLHLLDITWLLLGFAYLAGGPQIETAGLGWFTRSTRGLVSLVLLVGAIITMAIEIFIR